MSTKKFYETEDFKNQNEVWAKKLKEVGFEDIEDDELEYVVRPQVLTVPKDRKGSVEIKSRVGADQKLEVLQTINGLDYYQWCQTILRDLDFRHEFDTMAEKRRPNPFSKTRGQKYEALFRLHADGLEVRKISSELLEKHGISVSYQGVWLAIQNIKERYQRG